MIKSYNDLTVGKYQELRKLELEGLDALEQQVAILAVLNDMDEDEVFNMPLADYQKLASDMHFLDTQPVINTKHNPKTIKIGGEEYDVVQDARDLTAGQYIDYQHYLGVEDFDGQLPNILTVFVIPKGKKYGEGYNMAELANTFKEKMPIITAMEISSFFLRQSLTSIKASLTSLRLKMRMMKMTTRKKEVKEMMQEAIDKLGLLKDSISSLDGLTQP